MAGSSQQTYTIADFVEWHEKDMLELSPDFQRGDVWTPAARTFLIDTILKGLSIPQVYIRTRVDTKKKVSIREVVDGQQRLKAILDFASDKLRLSTKSNDFSGKKYSSLTDDEQEQFLSYQIATVQLINAKDEDVLEVFARLNSYSVKVTPPELRHAKYSEPIKWAVWNLAQAYRGFITDNHILTTRDVVRMKDNTLVAELMRALISGIQDGGEQKIDAFYRAKTKEDENYFESYREKFDEMIGHIKKVYEYDLSETTFFDAPNFLILFYVVSAKFGYLPENSQNEKAKAAPIESFKDIDDDKLIDALRKVAVAVENNEADGPHARFVINSKSSTQRLAQRLSRFQHLASLVN
ncbi:DUF262 domain-containing protein [Parvularcula oceani]|uniref:DUF262 domain-containing protein n=1 Tax=Parvularcula oceani TaxID=1247963 RepID=UPI0009DFE06A|nr:DUF262 domain-containing protein [Parvularcula oceani]